MKHKIKVSVDMFEDISRGKKTFLIRGQEDNFDVGDTIIIKEFEHKKNSCPRCVYNLPDESCTCHSLDKATGNKVKCKIIYIEEHDDYNAISIKIKKDKTKPYVMTCNYCGKALNECGCNFVIC